MNLIPQHIDPLHVEDDSQLGYVCDVTDQFIITLPYDYWCGCSEYYDHRFLTIPIGLIHRSEDDQNLQKFVIFSHWVERDADLRTCLWR